MSQESAGDSVDEIFSELYQKGATDGLPVIPPTEDRVDEMLRGTNLPSDEILGHLGNREDAVTVRSVAVNGVMAGCLPTHMPVLVAGTKALTDPESNSLAFSVSTTGWAYLWAVNGPIRDDINIQSGSGAWGPGFRANQTIARALGLIYKNTTRIHPGEKDMAVLGNPFKFSLLAGEHEEESPWEPYHVEHGFDPNESTVTLAGPSIYVSWTPYRNQAEYVLEGMVQHMTPYMVAGDGVKTVWQILCPYSAEQLAEADLSKADVKEYVSENSYINANQYALGKYQDREIERDDPRDKVPSLQLPKISDPDTLKVLTIGGPGTVNAILGPSIGGPVTVPIVLPSGWDELVDEYTVETNWYQSPEYYE